MAGGRLLWILKKSFFDHLPVQQRIRFCGRSPGAFLSLKLLKLKLFLLIVGLWGRAGFGVLSPWKM
jgi:hypothetical protein